MILHIIISVLIWGLIQSLNQDRKTQQIMTKKPAIIILPKGCKIWEFSGEGGRVITIIAFNHENAQRKYLRHLNGHRLSWRHQFINS